MMKFKQLFLAVGLQASAVRAIGVEKKMCKYKVYVYEIGKDSLFWDFDKIRHAHLQWNDLDAAFGRVDEAMPESMRYGSQWGAARMLNYQLKRSPCRTRNATKADLFFAPILIAPKEGKQWRNECQVAERAIVKELKYLTPRTACRHFIFFPKTFRACSTGSFWYNPQDARLWQMAKLAYDAPLPYESIDIDIAQDQVPFIENFRDAQSGLIDRCRGYYGTTRTKNREELSETSYFSHGIDDCFVPFPHIYSTPYSSSLHWPASGIDPTVSRFPYHNRSRLILFIGSIDKHASTSLRNRMHSVLAPFNCSSIYCHYEGTVHGPTLLAKGRSIFCLEPGGDSPSRKSISDSIAFGCIPVIFGNATAQQYSYFWNPKMRVDISLHDIMHKPDSFLLNHLQSIANNEELLAEKRAELDRVKKLFTYSTFADSGDAVDRILDLVYDHATRLKCSSSWRMTSPPLSS